MSITDRKVTYLVIVLVVPGGDEVDSLEIPSRILPMWRRNARTSRQYLGVKQKHIVVATLRIGKSLFTRVNSAKKTCPVQKEYSNGEKSHLHAEIRVLSRFVGEDLRGPMLVTRWSREKSGFTMAKPCKCCTKFIRENFPHLEVIYTDRYGNLVWL